MNAPFLIPPTVAEIQRQVAASFGIRREHILCRDRHPSYCYPRHAAMYLAKSLTHHSLSRIAHLFQRADHTTVIHAIRATERRISEDREFARKIDTLCFCLSPQFTGRKLHSRPLADVELAA